MNEFSPLPPKTLLIENQHVRQSRLDTFSQHPYFLYAGHLEYGGIFSHMSFNMLAGTHVVFVP